MRQLLNKILEIKYGTKIESVGKSLGNHFSPGVGISFNQTFINWFVCFLLNQLSPSSNFLLHLTKPEFPRRMLDFSIFSHDRRRKNHKKKVSPRPQISLMPRGPPPTQLVHPISRLLKMKKAIPDIACQHASYQTHSQE